MDFFVLLDVLLNTCVASLPYLNSGTGRGLFFLRWTSLDRDYELKLV